MKLIVTSEHRFIRLGNGDIVTPLLYPYSFWKRYLDVFEHVYVLARVGEQREVPADVQHVEGEGVTVVPLPYYKGPWQYLCRRSQVREVVGATVDGQKAAILRVGSQIADDVIHFLKKRGQPYGLEVVGDPWDVFAPGSITHPLRPFFRRWFSERLKAQCREACAVAYVTEQALQKRYPPGHNAYATHYSSIQLSDEDFVMMPKEYKQCSAPHIVVSVGSMEHMYKGYDILIHAVRRCMNNGLDIELWLVGDGAHRATLQAMARDLGIGRNVRFYGAIANRARLLEILDQADVFVLASRQEGLPRAMIEAMARAIPCIGTRVGGIGELIPEECLVDAGDIEGLSDIIARLVTDSGRMARYARNNLNMAKKYHEDVIRKKRNDMYRHVKEMTEKWQRDNPY